MQPRILVLIAFVIITVLSALAVLAAAVGWLPNADEKLVSWGIPAVLGEIVATMVMFFKGQWESQMIKNITFDEVDPADIDLDGPNCRYTIVDSSGRELNSGNVAPSFGHDIATVSGYHEMPANRWVLRFALPDWYDELRREFCRVTSGWLLR